jgi:hypothetical protein
MYSLIEPNIEKGERGREGKKDKKPNAPGKKPS